MNPTKTKGVNEWPILTMAKGVRGFLGLVVYYRKFINGFGGIAAPLTRLLIKDGFHWNLETIVAFN